MIGGGEALSDRYQRRNKKNKTITKNKDLIIRSTSKTRHD